MTFLKLKRKNMKFLKVIYISIGLLLIITLVGCNSVQKGSKKPVRLKEPRIAPLTESQWNEEQIKLLTPLKREDGSVLNLDSAFRTLQ